MSSAVTIAATGLAHALVSDVPGTAPPKGVIFLLSLAGHRRAGALRPVELHRRTRRAAQRLNQTFRTKHNLAYDPLDIVEFNSFADLLRKKPPAGTLWRRAIIVTHAGGERPGQTGGSIFLGSYADNFEVDGSGGELLDAINARMTAVRRFRAGFAPPTNLTVIGCGVGSTGPDVGAYMRELFGTEGLVTYPLKDVDFAPNGAMGTPTDPDRRSPLRDLRDDEWGTIPRKDAILNVVDPLPPAAFGE